jgi:hypothetical protein
MTISDCHAHESLDLMRAANDSILCGTAHMPPYAKAPD